VLWTSPEEAVAVIHAGQAALGALNPAGTQVAVAGLQPGAVLLYDVARNQVVQTLADGPPVAARWLAYDPTGRYLALITSGGTELRLWDVKTGARQLPDLPLDGFLSLAFHPGGQYLALGKLSGYVKILHIQTGVSVFSARVHNRRVWELAFSRDGQWLLSGGEGGAYLWRLDRSL